MSRRRGGMLSVGSRMMTSEDAGALERALQVLIGALAGLEVARDVARDRVDLEVQLPAGADAAQVRHAERVRNQHDLEAAGPDSVHGQRHAVERDRALLRDEAEQRAVGL